MSNEPLRDRWTEAMRTKQWVTAFNDGSRKDIVPVRIDILVAKIGGRERIVYRAGPHDVEIGGPIVSPDGTRLAFVKTYEEHGRHRTSIYGMAIDGSGLKELVRLVPPRRAIGGVDTGPAPLAWSHDNEKIVFFGTPLDEAITGQTPDPSSAEQEKRLMLIEVGSGRLVTLLPAIDRRAVRSRLHGPDLTSQAWAPDNRRLVYVDARGHVMIMDTAAQSETDIGPGHDPTWSPDGRFIAFQRPGELKSGRGGDYMLFTADQPGQLTLLLSNTPRGFWRRGIGYAGAAIWSPDSRYVRLIYVPTEQGYPYLFDRITGEGTKLPFRSLGHSWGGKR